MMFLWQRCWMSLNKTSSTLFESKGKGISLQFDGRLAETGVVGKFAALENVCNNCLLMVQNLTLHPKKLLANFFSLCIGQ